MRQTKPYLTNFSVNEWPTMYNVHHSTNLQRLKCGFLYEPEHGSLKSRHGWILEINSAKNSTYVFVNSRKETQDAIEDGVSRAEVTKAQNVITYDVPKGEEFSRTCESNIRRMSISKIYLFYLFIQAISLAPLQAQRRSHHSTVSEFHAEAPQGTASEGLAQGSYKVARAGFKPHDPSDERQRIYQWATTPHPKWMTQKQTITNLDSEVRETQQKRINNDYVDFR